MLNTLKQPAKQSAETNLAHQDQNADHLAAILEEETTTEESLEICLAARKNKKSAPMVRFLFTSILLCLCFP
jgi:tRNA 2-selenouridine synthase SelU